MRVGQIVFGILWTGGVAAAGFLVGGRGAPKAADAPKVVGGYEYHVVTLMDLCKDLPTPDGSHFTQVGAKWENLSDPVVAASRESGKKSAAVNEVELQRRTAAEINRMGREGWEFGDFGKDAWPVEVPSDGLMFFRRPR
jgi:hypothetical protein